MNTSTSHTLAPQLQLGALNRALMLAFAGLAASASQAQTVPAPAEAASAADSGRLQAVVVTGTSIRGIAPSGSATVSLTAKEILASGKTSAVDIVRTMPQIQNIGADESRTAGRDGAADNSGKGSAINLRGLGNNATLMLIDGRRVAPNGTASSFGDPNQIPAIALERIEVVTDGSSGIYGSDAVAGVVNLILRKSYDGLLASATHTSNGDYHQNQGSLLFGKNFDAGGFVLAYQRQERRALLQGASPYMRADLRPLGGNDGRLVGTTTAPGPAAGNIVAGSGTAARLYGIPTVTSGAPTLAQITGNLNQLNLVDTSDYVDYLPKLKRDSLTYYGEHELSERFSIFVEGFYNRRESMSRSYPTSNLTVKPNTPFYVAGVPGASAVTGYTVQYPLYSAFGPTENIYPEQSRALTVGLDTKLGGDWKATRTSRDPRPACATARPSSTPPCCRPSSTPGNSIPTQGANRPACCRSSVTWHARPS